MRSSSIHLDLGLSEQGVTQALGNVVVNIQNSCGTRQVKKMKQLGKGGFGVVWLASTDDGQVSHLR